MTLNELFTEEKVRLDPKCWTGKKIGDPKTKVKGGVRVNNCVPAESIAEGSEESYMIIRTDAEGKQDVFAKFDTYEKAQKELDACLAHPLHTKYKQKFELKRKGQQGVAEAGLDEAHHGSLLNPKKGQFASVMFQSEWDTNPQIDYYNNLDDAKFDTENASAHHGSVYAWNGARWVRKMSATERTGGGGGYGSWEENKQGVAEMDKSQTPPGRDGSNDPDASKKEYTAKTITPKKAAKDAVKILNKVFNKKTGVAEGSQEINWIKPNFDFEWHEVEEQSRMKQVPVDVRRYYQKHFPNKDAWLKAVQNGKAVVVPPDHNYEIRNAPFDKASLQKVLAPTGHEGPIGPAKEKRVNDLFDKGQVEMPIILKTSQGLWLIGGKTRLGTANYVKGLPAKVWLIDDKQGVAEEQELDERWSKKYKSSINCSHPKGFSQKAHCAGKKKHNESIEMEMVCEDCGMCETHADHKNLDEACWQGYHKEGNKKMFGKTYPNCVKNEDVAENAVPQLTVPQLATISDEALDNAYHYGRSTPGNTFGWQANLKSAAYAKQMIDQGITDIEAISDAIHKGWNVTAQAFVQNPDQFDDTAKLAAAGKLEAKLQQRAQLMKQNYAQLPEEEKEKDRVVARALLQAIRGEQGMAEGKPREKEADYGADYQAMVARVKHLAGLGPLKTVWDPQKRVYKNVPVAVQPKK